MSRYADLWPVVPDWAEWIATDEDGTVKYFSGEPVVVHKHWAFGMLFGKVGHSPTPDWRDSLERRPEEHRR
jgi:hypothetical protein